MRLPSLKQKIEDKFAQPNLSEADVVYLLIEIAKYIGRSHADKDLLRYAGDITLDADNYPSVYFFRNWAAHTEKERWETFRATYWRI